MTTEAKAKFDAALKALLTGAEIAAPFIPGTGAVPLIVNHGPAAIAGAYQLLQSIRPEGVTAAELDAHLLAYEAVPTADQAVDAALNPPA